MQDGINNVFYYNGHQVRSTTYKGELWFAVVDICRALNIYRLASGKYVKTSQATHNLIWGDEKNVFSTTLCGLAEDLSLSMSADFTE